MATDSQAEVTNSLSRNVLLRSWADLSVYDQAAARLKKYHINRRYRVISMTLTATVAAVLTSITHQDFLAGVFALLSIILPIIGSFLMNDTIRFTGTTTWIKYRYIAETIRMHIYLYRMQAPPYSDCPITERDDLLSKNVRAARDEIELDEVIPPNIRKPESDQEIEIAIVQANSYTLGDDGLSNIDLDKYIQWRLKNQREWYDSKVHDDYGRLKTNTRLSQGFLLAGAVISALMVSIDVQLVALVAVTSAISVALTSYSNISMFGKTYSLFLLAALQLSDHQRDWEAMQDNPELQGEEQRNIEIGKFVAQTEAILLWERKAWYNLAIQVQTTSDQTILSSLETLTKRSQSQTL